MTPLAAKLLAPLVAALVSVEIIGNIDWSSTITLGSVIIGILLGLSGLAIFGYGVKYKTAYEAERAVSGSLKDGREAFKARADRLEQELKDSKAREADLSDQIIDCKSQLARLEERPDLTRVLQIMGEQSVRQDAEADRRAERAIDQMSAMFANSLNHHDKAARDRQEQIIKLLREKT